MFLRCTGALRLRITVRTAPSVGILSLGGPFGLIATQRASTHPPRRPPAPGPIGARASLDRASPTPTRLTSTTPARMGCRVPISRHSRSSFTQAASRDGRPRQRLKGVKRLVEGPAASVGCARTMAGRQRLSSASDLAPLCLLPDRALRPANRHLRCSRRPVGVVSLWTNPSRPEPGAASRPRRRSTAGRVREAATRPRSRPGGRAMRGRPPGRA